MACLAVSPNAVKTSSIDSLRIVSKTVFEGGFSPKDSYGTVKTFMYWLIFVQLVAVLCLATVSIWYVNISVVFYHDILQKSMYTKKS